MDTQALINGAFAFIMAVGGWFAREVWGAVKELRSDLHQIEVELPRHYIRRDEFNEIGRAHV